MAADGDAAIPTESPTARAFYLTTPRHCERLDRPSQTVRGPSQSPGYGVDFGRSTVLLLLPVMVGGEPRGELLAEAILVPAFAGGLVGQLVPCRVDRKLT
jgi:hypothetical protein